MPLSMSLQLATVVAGAHFGICMLQEGPVRCVAGGVAHLTPPPSWKGAMQTANLVTIMHASLNIFHMNFNENCVVELKRPAPRVGGKGPLRH